MNLLEVKNLTFKYPGANVAALDDVSFTVNEGDFILICGETGSGKTTLLRLLKRELAPAGEENGEIYYKGSRITQLSADKSAREIGYVMQKPEQQIVSDSVWHEIAFGLESFNLANDIIRRRVCEMAAYFGMEDMFDRSTDCLSGGQKQLLNLASVLVLQPGLLILDEPTAQLDPITASSFLTTITKLNREMGMTVIIAEHRLDEVMTYADRLMLFEEGRLVENDDPHTAAGHMGRHPAMLNAMPYPVRMYHERGGTDTCPVSVKEARSWLAKYGEDKIQTMSMANAAKQRSYKEEKHAAIEMKNITFGYTDKAVINNLAFDVKEGMINFVLGGNAAGKTTMLNIAAGLLKGYKGRVNIFGRNITGYKPRELYGALFAMIPQDVQTLFTQESVEEELEEMVSAGGSREWIPAELRERIERVSDRHPYDLSGGEQQLCAFAKVLCMNPKILILDEFTKGLDASLRKLTSEILMKLKAGGTTILAVTHDVEFAAQCADYCSLFFNGSIVSEGKPEDFFRDNYYYTTNEMRVYRHLPEVGR